MVLTVLPMFFDLPTTHAVFPNVSTWHLFNISSTPRGVAGINPGSPVQYRPERKRKWKWDWWYKLTDDINYSISIPIFVRWNPSTSLWGATALQTVFSLICDGRGSCISNPSTDLSLFSWSIKSSNCSYTRWEKLTTNLPLANSTMATTCFILFKKHDIKSVFHWNFTTIVFTANVLLSGHLY